jgi:hypothetical protein
MAQPVDGDAQAVPASGMGMLRTEWTRGARPGVGTARQRLPTARSWTMIKRDSSFQALPRASFAGAIISAS